MSLNPMHQFEVYKIGPEINLGGINLSFTNASLFMTICSILILSLLIEGTKAGMSKPTVDTISTGEDISPDNNG